MTYANTNEKLYDDIALWEKTDGKDLFLEMPLKEKKTPKILDFGYGFGEQLFALANAYPKGSIFGIDGSTVCQKEVADKITRRKISNITLINKMVNDLSDFEDNSMDLLLLYKIHYINFFKNVKGNIAFFDVIEGMAFFPVNAFLLTGTGIVKTVFFDFALNHFWRIGLFLSLPVAPVAQMNGKN